MRVPKLDLTHYTPTHLSLELGVPRSTIYWWIATKRVKAVRLGGPMGNLFIPKTETTRINELVQLREETPE